MTELRKMEPGGEGRPGIRQIYLRRKVFESKSAGGCV